MAAVSDNTTCENLKTPASQVYLKNLEIEYLVLTISAGIIVMITTIILVTELIFIYTHREKWPQPGKTMWLLSLYTVFAWTAFVGVLVPRSGDLGAMVATMYLAASIFVFRRLMVSYYGGTRKMIERLWDSEYNLRSPPCCCCLCCLPKVKVTETSSIIIEFLVIQFTIIQPLLVFIEAVFIADMQENLDDRMSVFTNAIGTVSSLLALYGLILFFRVSFQHLAYAGIAAKFVCLKLLVGIDSLQKFILSALATGRVIPCASGLNHKDNALRIGRLLMILEAFLISVLARMYYKRDQNLHLHPSYSRTLEDSTEADAIIKSGSSNMPSEQSSTLVDSSEPWYGTMEPNNGNDGSLTIPKSIITDNVQTQQPTSTA